MKHIVRTMPRKEWQDIVSGRRDVDLMKWQPQVDSYTTRVYVVLDGESFVAGYYTIGLVCGYDSEDYVWEKFGDRLAMTYEDFMRHTNCMTRYIYVCEIQSVYAYDAIYDLEEYFGIETRPHPFLYTNVEPYMRGALVWCKSNQNDAGTEAFM